MTLVLIQFWRQPAVVLGNYSDPLEAELVREVMARAERRASVWLEPAAHKRMMYVLIDES